MNKIKIKPYPLYNSDNPLLSGYKDSLDVFRDKPFWIWDQDEHNKEFMKTTDQCCFNHIIGKPVKNDKEFQNFLNENQAIVLKTLPNHYKRVFWKPL